MGIEDDRGLHVAQVFQALECVRVSGNVVDFEIGVAVLQVVFTPVPGPQCCFENSSNIGRPLLLEGTYRGCRYSPAAGYFMASVVPMRLNPMSAYKVRCLSV